MTIAGLQAIVDCFDPNDNAGVEIANRAMHRYWRDFLEAGIDATSVAKMMSPVDIWEHYEELTERGAVIDMTGLFSVSGEEFFDEDFTNEHWDELVDRGVQPDVLIDRCFAEYKIFGTTDLDSLLVKGVSTKKMLELSRDWLEFCEALPEEQVEILTWLYKHGLSKADIKEWLEKHAGDYMEDYVVESNLGFYEEFDMDTDVAIDQWLNRHGHMYFYERRLSDLPNAISVDRLIDFHTMREIVDNCVSYGSFDGFIAEYTETGRDVDVLARKFVDEIGYSSNPSDSDAMFDLVWRGASATIIEPERFVESIDLTRLEDGDARIWHDCLESIGYDKRIIRRLLD